MVKTMDTVIEEAFWHYATVLVQFIVPIVVLYFVFRWISDLLLGGNR
jgi:hypothetical protein